jgi:hypothetical protein
VFTFQPGPCSRLDLGRRAAVAGEDQGRRTRRFRGDVPRNCMHGLPECGLAALNL